jgi:DNA-binding response OmpR family regulator
MSSLHGRTAIVIEDEALLSLFVEDCLVQFGMQVLAMPVCVEEALDCLACCRPDVAVIDMNLRGCTAMPIVERLEALGVPFVVATGYGDEGRPAHRDDVPVLGKPYDVSELRAAMERLLSSRLNPVRDIAC